MGVEKAHIRMAKAELLFPALQPFDFPVGLFLQTRNQVEVGGGSQVKVCWESLLDMRDHAAKELGGP